jgi:GNAT superfamily N-acetyltransferase
MDALEIRHVTEADHAAWAPLWRGYQSFYEVDLPDVATKTLWARLLDPQITMYGAIAWDGTAAVGVVHWLLHRFTWTVEDLCYLNDLFVLPDRRAQGIGRRLIEHVYEAARSAGSTEVYWLTHETNTTGQALYNKVAQRTGFIHYGHKLG